MPSGVPSSLVLLGQAVEIRRILRGGGGRRKEGEYGIHRSIIVMIMVVTNVIMMKNSRVVFGMGILIVRERRKVSTVSSDR